MQSTTTSPNYALYALAGDNPLRPGLKRVADSDQGNAIYVEVWALPHVHVGSFLAGIPAPLGMGKLELVDGRWVTGFICEPYGFDDAQDITPCKDWRQYVQSLA